MILTIDVSRNNYYKYLIRDKEIEMKRLLRMICTVIVIALLLLVYKKATTKIILNSSNFQKTYIAGFGSIGMNTEDKKKIETVVKYLGSVTYYKVDKRKVHNESPDVSIYMYSDNEKVAEEMEFYGNLLEYKGTQYKVIPFMNYNKLEKLCKKLNEK